MREFDVFWANYPKRMKKGDAVKAWEQTRAVRPHLDVIVAKLRLAKQSAQWIKDGGQFIPLPATWLRAWGWEDEHEVDLGTEAANGRPWYETASGIEAKGAEHGLSVSDFPNFQEFRAAVLRAAKQLRAA